MTRKYGRTLHLPQSPGATKDDGILKDLSVLMAADQVIITEQMDGENTTLHAGGCHPRSPDARYHPSRDWMKAFAAGVSPQLAPDERIVGEYLYARHSVPYSALPSYFLGFAWIAREVVQSWPATLDRFAALGITPVPVLFEGRLSEATLTSIINDLDLTRQEGLVVRDAAAFPEAEQSHRLGKYMRAGHVQSDTHWISGACEKNTLG